MKLQEGIRRVRIERSLLLLADFLSITASTALTWWLRFRSGLYAEAEPFDQPWLMYVVFSFFWISIFALRGQYRKLYHISRFQSLQEVVKSVFVGLVILFLITTNPADPLGAGRLMLLSYGAVLVAGAGFGRVFFRTVQKRLLEQGIGQRRTLIIGASEAATKLIGQFRRHPGMGYHVVGRIDPEGCTDPAENLEAAIGSLDQLAEICDKQGVMECVVTDPGRELLFRVIHAATGKGVDVLIVPDLYDLVLGNVKAFNIWGMPVIQVFPHLMAPWQFLLKRLLDIFVSLFMLVLGLPILLFVPLLILLEDPGTSVIFRQKRVGRGGREFMLLKFRTMRPAMAVSQLDDERILSSGRWIRRYRLDEWPQFLNILRGDMSFVGPRPEQKALVDDYIRRWPLYARRHNVRPGLTGWAQVRQRYDQSLKQLEDKLGLDLFYLENMSLGLDLKVLVFTIRTVLKGDG
jgi:exopolysaccharide biosynthesis polyprenyl glycosylphosphotransferase